MLSENQINALPFQIEQRLIKLNDTYLQLIGERIKEIGTLSATDAHRLAQMSTFSDVNTITADLARITEKNVVEIYEIFDTVAKENAAFSEQFYKAVGMPSVPYEQNEVLQKYVHALAKQTADEYINLSQHTAFMAFKDGKKTITSLSQAYSDIIDMAVTKTSLGLESYQSTMRHSLRQLAQSGIRTADYATGYTRRLDTAVRQNILWGVKQCSQGMQDITGEEFGADGYEISYHSNPRPSHADMGGKQYTQKEFHRQGIDLLLSDYGCLHFKFSILCGVSEPNWNADELAKMKANDKRTIEFEGKSYTGYEATQMQRKLETAIRHSKDATNLFKSSGDTVGRLTEQGKLNTLVVKYGKFSKTAGLSVKKERMSVSGYRPVKTHAQKLEGMLRGKTTANGITISGISSHTIDRALERGVSLEVIKDALINPLHIGIIKTDELGRHSQRFIGEFATINVNPDTGNIATVWITGKSKVKKYKGGNE